MKLKKLVAAMSPLTPFDVLDGKKVRIGSSNDGGYVMIDNFRPSQPVFSYGLSWNIAFEMDLATRGHTIFMFDHTIEALTQHHTNFNWFKEGLDAVTKAEQNLFSLADHVDRLAPSATDMILKLDVEGAEWDALASIAPDLLVRFEQIVLELHDLHLFGHDEWCDRAAQGLGKLAEYFTLHHVHANNHAPLLIVDGLTVADVIEVSYIRSDLVGRRRSTTLFPSDLDAPNDPTRREFPLWFYPFAPVGGSNEAGVWDEARTESAARFDQIYYDATLAQELAASNQ